MRHIKILSVFFLYFLFLLTGCNIQNSGNGQNGNSSEATNNMTINVSNVMRTVTPGIIMGGNMGAWVGGGLLTGQVSNYFAETGPKIMRFPGGNIANSYCWQTDKLSNTSTHNWDDWSWGTSISQYVNFIKEIGCAPLYSVNPFSHTINGTNHNYTNEAIELVKFMATNGLPGGYYEVGNENDGSWNPMLSIPDYVSNFIELAAAMKSQDPSIKMMGPVVSGYNTAWIDGFISQLNSKGKLNLLDYFDYHYYGGYIANDNTNMIDLNNPQNLAAQIQYIRNKLNSYGGASVKIAVTEYNASIWSGTTRDQFTIENALWLVQFICEIFKYTDLADIWITMHTAGDPHTMIEDTSSTRTKNYWMSYFVNKIFTGGSNTNTNNINILNLNSQSKSTKWGPNLL